MHHTVVWQHSSNSNIKIVHNSIEHFLWNPSDFSFDEVLSCLWIVFINSVFQVLPQKIVRWVEILGIGWPGVIGLMWIESVPWEVMPEVFKCSVREMRWVYCWRNEEPPHFLNRTLEYLRHNSPWDRLTSHQTDNPVPSYSQDLNPPWLFSEGVLERQSLWKQFTDKRGHHQKRNQMNSTRNAR